MKDRLYIASAVFFLISALFMSCEEITSYPDEPHIEYKSFGIYSTTDALGNTILLGKLEIEFTDGDGDIGIYQPDSTVDADTLKYNLFMKLHAYQNGKFVRIEDETGDQNFRIPYIERKGQNKTLQGTINVDIEYKKILYDTIFYTFYIMDREFHRSNTDSTEVIVFTGINI